MLLTLVGIGGYYLGSQKDTKSKNSDNIQYQTSPQINYEKPAPSILSSDQPWAPDWLGLISYTVPKGWKETTLQYEQTPALTSPDFVAETEGMLAGKPKSGLLIHFIRFSNDEQRTIQQEETEFRNTAGVQEVSRVTVGGLPAVHTRINYEGSKEMYIIVKDGYRWFITIETPNTLDGIREAYDNNNEALIQFINSIKFTDK